MDIALETYIALMSVTAIVSHLVLRYALHWQGLKGEYPLLLVLALGGMPLLYQLGRRVLAGEFGSDLLAGISIVSSALVHQYLVGAIVVLMLSGGTALEAYATRRASSVLDALARRMPSLAHRKTESGMVDVTLAEIVPGDTLVVLPNEICPVDGEVIEGDGSMNEAYLTGEPYEVDKVRGAQVLSGALNGSKALTIVAGKIAAESRYARIMEVVRQSEQNRPALRRIADRLGAWYTPLAVSLAVLGWVLSGNPLRFLAVIVIATPCPLLIAIPVAVIGAISLGAGRGIIVRNPAALEAMESCRTAIFDKTGTLTYGCPSLTSTVCLSGFEGFEAIRLAASLEQFSKHPLSKALLDAARSGTLALRKVTQISEVPGRGLTGVIDGQVIAITGRAKLSPGNCEVAASVPAASTGLECALVVDDRLAALFSFRDELRQGGRPFVKHLKPRHRIERVILLSGDREEEVKHVAESLGIDEIYFRKSPEEKLAIVRAEVALAPVLYVGDGINDAAAMMAATVGIAMGSANDVTSEAADAVLMDASLGKVDELIHIGTRMRRIALQSAVAGMGLSMIGMLLAANGLLPPLTGAVAQEVIDLATVLNALRVSFRPASLRDF